VARVFVSHATADLAIAETVRDWLRGERHQVFLDRDLDAGLRVGQRWKSRLYAELRAADAVVCVLTAAYLDSPWCTAEVGIADALGSRLLPLQVTPGLSSALLADRQYVEFGPASPWREELAAALRAVDAAGGLGWADDRSPFPGLRPFEFGMARAFCGRGAEVRQLASRLRSAVARSGGGPLLVTGPSGCGKSSLVRAGLAARMAAEPGWEVAYPVLPGAEPIRALARALAATANRLGLSWTIANTEQALGEDDGLALLAEELLVAGPGPAREWLLLVVDQGEELVTRAEPAQSARVMALLRCAGAGRVRTVFTLRSEFQDRLLALAGVEMDAFALRPLARDMLRVVIEEPARLAGLSVDRELVDRLVADTDSGEALPLLAFTLDRLADGLVRGDTVSTARYDRLGGVRGALARQAEAALAAAVEASGRTRAEVLSTLVRLASLDPAGQPTRHRVDLAELTEPERAAVAVFVERRLLTTATDEDRCWVGVAHEALLTSWQSLADAITAQAAALHAARSVEQAAVEWDRAGRPDDHLWERGRVGEARRALAPADLGAAAAAFLRAGQRHGDRVRFRAVALLSVALLLVSGGGLAAVAQWRVAVSQREEARQQRLVAVGRQFVGQAVALRNSQPRLALALSTEAYRLAPTLPEVRDNLLSLQGSYYSGLLLPAIGAVHAVAFARDGRLLAAAGHDGTVGVWRLPGRSIIRLPATGPVYGVAVSGDGRLLAAGGESGVVQVWDVATLRQVAALRAGRGAVYGLAFSPDSTVLAAGGSDGDVVLWDRPARWRATRLRGDAGSGGWIGGVAFTPDGLTLISATSDPGAVLTFWDLRSGRPGRAPGDNGPIRAVAVSPSGRLVASGGDDGSVRLWDVTTHKQVAAAVEHTGAVRAVAFSPDGRTVASGGEDGSVRLWSAGPRPSTLNQLTSLLGPTQGVLGVAFSADGSALASAGSDTAVGLWNVSRPADDHLPGVYAAAAFGPGGIVATAGRDHRPRLWDAAGSGTLTPRRALGPLPPPAGSGPAAFGMAFSPTGTMLATPGTAESAVLWDVRTGAARTVAGRSRYPVHAVALSPRGDTVASASARADGDVDLRSTATLRTVASAPSVHTGPINGVGLGPAPGHPDDLLLAVASDDGYVSVSSTGGGPLVLLPEHTTVPVDSVALSPDGTMLASGSENGTVRLWHAAGPTRWTDLRLETPTDPVRPILGIAFNRDATMLAAAGADGLIRIWDLPGGRLAATLTGPAGTSSVAFRPDGDPRTFVTADQQGTPVLWDTDPARFRDRLCDRPQLQLTPAEWSARAPNIPYERACR
jgi:WD40 repeat protein